MLVYFSEEDAKILHRICNSGGLVTQEDYELIDRIDDDLQAQLDPSWRAKE